MTYPTSGIGSEHSLDSALYQGVTVDHNGKSEKISSQAVFWLTKSMTFGVALVNLDEKAAYQDIVILHVDPQTQYWQLDGTSLREGQVCHSGTDTEHSIHFPEAMCSHSTLYKRPTIADVEQYTITSWFSSHHTYVVGHFSAVLDNQSLANMDQFSLGQYQAWRYENGLITDIIIPVDTSHFYLIAYWGAVDNTHIFESQVAPHLAELVPLQS